MRPMFKTRPFANFALILPPVLLGFVACGGGSPQTPPPAPQVVVAITPASAVVEPGYPKQFTATVTGAQDAGVTWSVQEGIVGGTTTSAGFYGAPANAPDSVSTYHIVATSVADPAKSAVAAITVKTLPKVAVSPASVHLAPGASKSFSSVVTFAQDTNVFWSVKEGAGGGTVTAAGIYTAPAAISGSIATYHVVATSVEDPTRTMSAEVTVQNGPTSGAWSNVGNVLSAREYSPAVVALKDGRVLLAGGYITPTKTFLDSAEIFDPATGISTPTGSMATPRYGAKGVLLKDGRVLVSGGSPAFSGSLATTEIFDPATGTWSAGPTMVSSRIGHLALLLKDGRVFVASAKTAEILDVAANTSSGLITLPYAQYNNDAALLLDGRVLMAGGRDGSYTTKSMVFDPATKTSTLTGQLSVARTGLKLVTLQSGKVLAIGGVTEGDNYAALKVVEAFDPATGQFTLSTPLSQARAYVNLLLLPNGQVLVAGGDLETDAGYTSACELIDAVTGQVTPTGSLAAPRGDGFLVPYLGGALYLGGHLYGSLPLNVERYQ